MDPLASFKQEVEAVFEKSFKELSQKNNLNRTILSNLVDAANEQTERINQLDQNIQGLRRTSNPETGLVKSELKNQQKIIHDNFDKMMFRLGQIEEGINHSKKNIEQNMQLNKQSEQSMNELLKHLQKIQRQEGIPQYDGNSDQLYQQIQEFEKLIDIQTERIKSHEENIQISKKIMTEPLQSFETKIAIHNKNNETILKDKLRKFSDQLKQMEKRVEDAAKSVKNETNKAKQQQNQLIEQMGKIQRQMGNLRTEIQFSDQKRKKAIQSNAANLDSMVEEMLSETKKLEIRVDQLKKGYEQETQKLKKNIH